MKQIMIATACLLAPALAHGQTTLASSIEVYVFPKGTQDATQQQQDEASCYAFAETNTGTDPFALNKQEAANEQQAAADMQAAQSAGAGSGARGAVRGAAAGAIIGEIADDDAGEGAAYGAAIGAMRGRRQGRRAQAEAEQQAAARAENNAEATAHQVDNFKKAFSACLEAKEYIVKY